MAFVSNSQWLKFHQYRTFYYFVLLRDVVGLPSTNKQSGTRVDIIGTWKVLQILNVVFNGVQVDLPP